MNAEAKKPLKLFYCYARRDKDLRDELDIHLTGLKRQGLITSWYDGEIGAGTDWKEEIDIHLREAHIILLLVTPYFIASDYCYDIEMKRAVERHEARTARVIPIILQRTYRWEDAPFGPLQALPTDAKPVSQWSVREDALWDIAAGIDRAINAWYLSLKTAQEWFDEGVTLDKLGYYEDAVIAYNHVIHLNPNYVDAYNNKGLALRNLKCYADAIIAFDHAIRLDPNFATAYYNKGYALGNLACYTDAIIAFDHTIRLDPNNATAYYNKGIALGNLACYTDAIIAFDHTIRLDPNFVTVYYNKGYALYELGRYEEAITAYDQAIRLDPNNATAYYNKGIALENLGKQCYQKARQLGFNE